jgi:uncharacterized membrane protein YkvA (DUF1232 family)
MNSGTMKCVIERMKLKSISIPKVLKRVQKHSRIMGQQTVYAAMLMVYAFRREGIPLYAKNIIIGAFGYLLMPFDALPDLTPLLGFTDDFGVLSFALVTVAAYINDDVRVKARKTVKSLFGELDLGKLEIVDQRL